MKLAFYFFLVTIVTFSVFGQTETPLQVLKFDKTIQLATKPTLAKSNQSRVLLFYFASWCQFCRQEAPEIQKLHTDFGKKIEVLGVSGDDELAQVVEVATKWKLSFPVYWDSEHHLKSFLKVKKIPRILYMDASGNILKDQTATSGADDFFTFIKADLEKIKK